MKKNIFIPQDILIYAYLSLVLIVFFAVNPIISGDTGGYTAISYFFNQADLTSYDWARTPGYPFFVFIIGLIFSVESTVFPSLIVSQAISLFQILIFLYAILNLYNSIKILYSINIARLCIILISPALAILSKLLLPESLVLSIMIIIVSKIISSNYKTIPILCSLLILLKPNFLPHIIIVLSYIFFIRKNYKFFLLPIITVLLICSSNFYYTGNFSFTNLGGLSKSQAVFNIFDRVDPADSVVGTILFEQYRNELPNGRADTWTRTADNLRKSVQDMPYKKSGKPWIDGNSGLSNYIGSVSNYLIIRYPDIVFKNFIKIFPTTFNFDLPEFLNNQASDPRSIDNLKIIKSDISYKIYRTIAIFYEYFYIILEIICIIFSIYRIILSKNYQLIAPFFLIILNKFYISFFGVFDPRYNWILIPIFIWILIESIPFKPKNSLDSNI